MNFSLIVFFTLIFVSACGVKGDPVSPKSVVVPSLIESYPDIQLDTPLGDNKKTK